MKKHPPVHSNGQTDGQPHDSSSSLNASSESFAAGRRRFIGQSAASLLGPLALGSTGMFNKLFESTVARAEGASKEHGEKNVLPARTVDVVVIGAGWAGVTAARRLQQAGKTVAVLEARDRKGGRTWTRSIGGLTLDVGGQWIGPQQRRMTSLADSLLGPAGTFETYNDGNHLLREDEINRPFQGLIPGLNIKSVRDVAKAKNFGDFKAVIGTLASSASKGLDMGSAVALLDMLATQVNLQEPWRYSLLLKGASRAMGVADLDTVTLEYWLRRYVLNEQARETLVAGLATVLSCDMSTISLLHTLLYIKSAGGLDNLMSTRKGQARRFTDGTASLIEKFAGPIEKSIVYNADVKEIALAGNGVVVTTSRVRVSAAQVIVTVPPAVYKHIKFPNGVEIKRQAIGQHLPMGKVVKSQAVYDSAFWREQGFSGQSAFPLGNVLSTFDNSHPRSKLGVLVGFSIGKKATQLGSLSEEARKALVVDDLVKLFGAKAANPRAFESKVWSEEKWSGGCYVGIATPGFWTGEGKALRQPEAEGKIHFAGTETATEWIGYMEGAVQSGERAAVEVYAPAAQYCFKF